MEFLAEYGLFMAKVITVVIAIVFVLGAIVAQSTKGKSGGDKGQVDIKKLNDTFDDYEQSLQEATLSHDEIKALNKQNKKDAKAQKAKDKKQAPKKKPNLYVLHFDGDVKASAVENLRQEINALLTVANKEDEVVINLESPGGMVHTYGLAASQLMRIKQAEITLTVCVDKVAASGGYMMACVANKIVAAPFAIIGSIGVLAQIPNFNRVLKKFDIDYDIMTAGEYKAPITMFGEITDKGKNKLKEELEDTHELFKKFITSNRPQVPIEKVATGEVWYGQQSIEHQLIDEIQTFDDYLMERRKEQSIYEISFAPKKSLQERLGIAVHQGISHVLLSLLNKEQKVRVTNDLG